MKIDLKYNFKNENLLEVALTHTSFSHEHKGELEHNERLEFLGDAVLELVISTYIFDEFSELSEGELTKLRASIVCEESLSVKSKQLNLGKILKLGRGEEQTGGRERDSVLADALEAIIGAVYLDSRSFDEAQKFIIGHMKDIIDEKRDTFSLIDSKTKLQELIQKTSQQPIKYNIIDEQGPPHNKVFKVEAIHNDKKLGVGTGKSKKDAEQQAAYEAIKFLSL